MLNIVKSILFCLLLTINSIAFAQAVLKGKAMHWAGDYLYLEHRPDFITQKTEAIGSTKVDKKGNFVFNVKLQEPIYATIRNNLEEYSIILKPEKSYAIKISAPPENYLRYINEDTSSLYYKLGTINFTFNKFFSQNYDSFFNGTIKVKVKSFLDSINTTIAIKNYPYAQNYLKYKTANLLLFSRTTSPKALYESFIKNSPPQPNNPEYGSFFRNLYKGDLLNIPNLTLKNKIDIVLKSGKGIQRLVTLSSILPHVGKGESAKWFVLNGLWEASKSKTIDKKKIISLLSEADSLFTDSLKQLTIKNIKNELQRISTGSKVPPLVLKDIKGERSTLSSFNDKPIYLMFFEPHTAATKKALEAINNLYKEYKGEMHLISVCVGCSYGSLFEFIKDKPYKWQFFLVDNKTAYRWEALLLPFYYLIDTNGTFARAPAEPPGKGISKHIYNLVR